MAKNSVLSDKHEKLEQSRINLTNFSLVSKFDCHCFIPIQLVINDLRLIKYCFLWVNNAEQSNNICTMSSVSTPQHLQIEFSANLLNLHMFAWSRYVPESILDYVIPFLTSDKVDSSDVHTACEWPIFSESIFMYFRVDFPIASLCKSSVQYLFIADLTCSFHCSFDVKLFLRLRRCGS